MQFTSFTYLAFAAAAMMGVEALPQPQKGGKIGAGDAIAGANAAAGIAGQIAGAIPKKDHTIHNCCHNAGGWQYDSVAVDLTKKVCAGFNAVWSNNACVEPAGASISGDAFYNACKNQKPGDDTIGAGYRGGC